MLSKRLYSTLANLEIIQGRIKEKQKDIDTEIKGRKEETRGDDEKKKENTHNYRTKKKRHTELQGNNPEYNRTKRKSNGAT